MVKVKITESLFKQIKKTFSKSEANSIMDLIETVEENPKKGKELANVGKVVIKELKYKKFRFYFITDGYKIKFLEISELQNLLIKFVAMSDKNKQQKTIDEIKYVLKNLGSEGFE